METLYLYEAFSGLLLSIEAKPACSTNADNRSLSNTAIVKE
jgi:hypothetical protein